MAFITTNGIYLELAGERCRVNGANYWQAMHLGMKEGPSGDRERVLEDLLTLSKRAGANSVRILASAEGPSGAPDRIYPALMTAPGEYSQEVFEGLDWFMAQLPRFGMTATISLCNYWSWSGGAAQYVNWATNDPIPYPSQWDHLKQRWTKGAPYQGFLQYANRFYSNSTIQGWYQQHIRAIVTRTNSVTGQKYSEDPNILAWELMNEPQITETHQELFDWIDSTAQFIHQLDPNHLITTGAESKDGPEWFHTMHRSSYITLASCHFWALNWGYYQPADPTDDSLEYSINKLQEFLQGNSKSSQELNLPLVLYEYGMVRDNWGEYSGTRGYLPSAHVTHRNRFFQAVKRLVQQNQLAGSVFWAYAGMARPPAQPTEELSWTGDPPHEPPGWNSVYDQDTETLSIFLSQGSPGNA